MGMTQNSIPVGGQMAWTSPLGNVEIVVRNLNGRVFNVSQGRPGGSFSETPVAFGSEFEARRAARLAAEIVTFNETGE